MLIKMLLGAVGTGVAIGIFGTSRLTGMKKNVVDRVRPRKNKVAIVEVELAEGESISDLAFLVVKGVPAGTSKNSIVNDLDIDGE